MNKLRTCAGNSVQVRSLFRFLDFGGGQAAREGPFCREGRARRWEANDGAMRLFRLAPAARRHLPG